MKNLPPPQMLPQDAYQACLEGIQNQELKNRFAACISNMDQAATGYTHNAKAGTLYSLPALITSDNDSDLTVFGNVSKSELNDLYDKGMVRRKAGRNIYDKILIAAEEKCPFCGGIGVPTTLDHYLPKANFPQFSVLPVNLVPCCSKCNSGEKGAQFATTPENQILHPYFEDDKFYLQQWVFARVERPCTLEFYVDPPQNWDDISKSRVATHFNKFGLAKGYSLQAANEFSTLIDQQSTYFRGRSSEDFKEFLLSCINTKLSFANYWRNVMYSSLANDDWFCEQQLQPHSR